MRGNREQGTDLGCFRYRDYRINRTATGKIIIMHRFGDWKSHDAAWMKLEKWEAIAPEKQQKFAPVCPDFVVQLRFASDNLQPLKDKLQEYMDNGASLGWLIDRQNRQVYVYRPNLEVECLDNPATVSGQSVLPGFVLDLGTIW